MIQPCLLWTGFPRLYRRCNVAKSDMDCNLTDGIAARSVSFELNRVIQSLAPCTERNVDHNLWWIQHLNSIAQYMHLFSQDVQGRWVQIDTWSFKASRTAGLVYWTLLHSILLYVVWSHLALIFLRLPFSLFFYFIGLQCTFIRYKTSMKQSQVCAFEKYWTNL